MVVCLILGQFSPDARLGSMDGLPCSAELRALSGRRPAAGACLGAFGSVPNIGRPCSSDALPACALSASVLEGQGTLLECFPGRTFCEAGPCCGEGLFRPGKQPQDTLSGLLLWLLRQPILDELSCVKEVVSRDVETKDKSFQYTIK
jgi:hypothetical protein